MKNIYALLFLFSAYSCYAQPANDDCLNANQFDPKKNNVMIVFEKHK